MSSGNIDSGLLLIGITNTVLFDGQGAIELLFLNLATGEEVTLPVSEQQAEYLIGCVGGLESTEDQSPTHETDSETDSDTDTVQQAVKNAWKESEKTPQL